MAARSGKRRRHPGPPVESQRTPEEIDLREDLAVLGDDAKVGVHPNELVTWAESSERMNHEWMAWLAPSLGVMAIAAAIVWAVKGIVTHS